MFLPRIVHVLAGFTRVHRLGALRVPDTCSSSSNRTRNTSQPGPLVFKTRAMSSSTGDNGDSASAGGHRNRLGLEKSPYLLQHASNPVDWYPWGPEAFAKAKKEDKPIFLSVGYSTCHWCHVMERESFENEEIGQVMNEHFINIKVDREERPDVDKVYMAFIHATTGHGGWPMSVWLTPDLKPIVGGTYFAPDDRYYGRPGFKSILEQIAEKWHDERDKMDEQGTVIVDALMRGATSQTAVSADDVNNIRCMRRCFAMLQNNYDEDHGGIGTKPKFPQPANFNFLLRMYADDPSALENKVALKMTSDTLQAMAKGGIHDHINNGFHRYSTDQQWHVPHFEKMLYDQAQLAVLYAETYQVTGDKVFAEMTRDILQYVSRDLSDPNGGFYSAEDADSLPTADHTVKKEGAFCVWEWQELGELLSERVTGHEQLTQADVFNHHYGVKHMGNTDPIQDPHEELKGQNVLLVKGSVAETAAKFCMTVEETQSLLEKCRVMLFEVRKKRQPPHLDTKMITAWNGLMISGFAKAGQILDDEGYLERATQAAQFVKTHLYIEDSGVLLRSTYAEENDAISQIERPIEGFADDYAFLIRGLLDLYEGTLVDTWLVWAERLQQTQNDLFWDADVGGYYNTREEAASIIIRMKDDHDGAEPSANSVSASNLVRLSQLLDRAEWRHLASAVLGAFGERLEKIPAALPEMVSAHMMLQAPPKQIIIAGDRDADDTRALLRCVRAHFLPMTGLLLADGDVSGVLYSRLRVVPTLQRMEGKATAYICENYACSLPVNTAEALEELLAV